MAALWSPDPPTWVNARSSSSVYRCTPLPPVAAAFAPNPQLSRWIADVLTNRLSPVRCLAQRRSRILLDENRASHAGKLTPKSGRISRAVCFVQREGCSLAAEICDACGAGIHDHAGVPLWSRHCRRRTRRALRQQPSGSVAQTIWLLERGASCESGPSAPAAPSAAEHLVTIDALCLAAMRAGAMTCLLVIAGPAQSKMRCSSLRTRQRSVSVATSTAVMESDISRDSSDDPRNWVSIVRNQNRPTVFADACGEVAFRSAKLTLGCSRCRSRCWPSLVRPFRGRSPCRPIEHCSGVAVASSRRSAC